MDDNPANKGIEYRFWANLPTVSSSGPGGTSPAERAAYLASIAPGADWLAVLAQQERAVERALDESEAATTAWRLALLDGTEDQREQAEAEHERTLSRYEAARDKLLVLLDAHERAASPIPPGWRDGALGY